MSDRDPLQQLADFGTGGPVNPLPAAEVRRLGDRRRARRTAVAAVAGVTAVLAVAVPAGLYAARDDGSQPPDVVETPTVTSIPEGFPLDRNAYEFGPDGTREGPSAEVEVERALPCDAEPLGSASELDRLAFVNGGGEFTDSRELLLFDDETAAREVLDETRRTVEGCDDDQNDGIRLTWRTENADTGQDSVTFIQGVPGAMGGTTYQYTRVGSAILTVQWASEGGGDLAEQTAITKAIVPDMCVFTAEGCPDDSPSPSSTPTVKEIADDFPLADGFPEQSEYGAEGYTGPSRTLDPVAYDLCGQPLPDPAFRDRLLAGYRSAEDHRTRQLTTYADADAAVAASRAVIEAFRECATEGPDADGYVSEREVRQLTLGGESWAVLDRATMNGSETPFGSTLLVVRLGRAVIIEDHSGHAGYPTDDGIQELSERLTAPIAAMCAFTQSGCGDDEAAATDTAAPEDTAAPDETEQPDTSSGGFGPSFGGLRLGDGFAEIEAAGWTVAGDGECVGLLPPGGGHMEQAMYQEGIGVASVSGPEGSSTPEGIRAGSSVNDLQAAYPGTTFSLSEGSGTAVVRLDGPGYWEFGIHDSYVMWVFLVHDDRTCTA